jgi:hypothetical protein
MKAKRVFSVEDESYSVEELKAERAERVRRLQQKRAAKNAELLAAWKRRLKRARREVSKREQRSRYYAKVLR